MRPSFNPTLLASIGGEVPVSFAEYGMICLAVVAVFIVIVCILGVVCLLWSTFRRTPPIERQIDDRIAIAIEKAEAGFEKKIVALHDEVHRLNQERRVTMAGLFEKFENHRKEAKDDLNNLSQSIAKSFQDMNYLLGRADGARESKKESNPAS